jgi:hypothetical protein
VVHVTRAFALALAAVLVVSLAPPRAAQAGPRAGHIVRVERPRTGARGTPRICRLNDAASAICWGRPPIKGEIGWLVGPAANGHAGNRGQATVGEVTASPDSCTSTVYWNVVLDTSGADLADLDTWSTLLVLDIDVGAGGKAVDISTIKDSPDPQHSPSFALARGRLDDAGDTADIVVTAYSCDAQGQPVPDGSPGYCLDYWFRASRWTMVRRDVAAPSTSCTP